MPGSVCRHLKIAGRVIISRLFHVTSQQPRKLQHIQAWQECVSAIHVRDTSKPQFLD